MRLTLRSYFLYDAERDLLAIAKFLVMYRQQLITLTLLDYAQCGLCLEKNNKHSRERICFYDTRQILQLSSGLCGEKLVLCLAVLPGCAAWHHLFHIRSPGGSTVALWSTLRQFHDSRWSGFWVNFFLAWWWSHNRCPSILKVSRHVSRNNDNKQAEQQTKKHTSPKTAPRRPSTTGRPTYTVFQKTRVTTASTISWTRNVRLQNFLVHLLLKLYAIDKCFPTSPI